MTATRSPYVSEFAYIPRLHPSRNPVCRSRFPSDRKTPSDPNDFGPPSIEVRAVLAPCSVFAADKQFDIRSDGIYARAERSYDEDRWAIKNCTQKIVINMKLSNVGRTDTRDKFVVIDHAVDPATMRKFPLQNPYVIKVRQEAVLQLYGLKFQSSESLAVAGKRIDRETLNKVVNAEATEDVINNETPNYRGCSVDPDSPTCGQTFLRGEPVPFSEGFCCLCDPKVTAVRPPTVSNGSSKSFPGEMKSGCNHAANKPRNRLAGAECTSSVDNPMARRQGIETEPTRSWKKSNTMDVDPCDSQTIVKDPGMSDACGRMEQRNKLIDAVSMGRPRDKETEKVHGLLVGSVKYAMNQGDGSSTLMSPLSPETGKMPSRNKMASVENVAQDRVLSQRNGIRKEIGKVGDLAEDHVKNRDEQSVHRSIEENIIPGDEEKENDHGLETVLPKPKTMRGDWRESGARVTRLKDPSVAKKPAKRTNQSADVIRLENPFRSWKRGARKKLATGRLRGREEAAFEGRGLEDRKGRGQSESLRGNKGSPLKSSAKKNKADIGRANGAIDSLAIRPAMHLNEPLKNLSTGVLNSNRSPTAGPGDASREGNLNSVMESTFSQPDIIVRSFNEKHEADGAGYFQSDGNEGNGRATGTRYEGKTGLSSMTRVSEENASAKKVSIEQRCRVARGLPVIENYTPQKRTLKDVSYKDTYNEANHKASKNRDGNRCRRHYHHFGHHKPRKNKVFMHHKSKNRARRRSSRYIGDQKEDSRKREASHTIQVYVDEARTFAPVLTTALKPNMPVNSVNNGTSTMGNGTQRNDDSFLRNEADHRNSVDKQIEEKFSRISDALKEDEAELKATTEQTPRMTTVETTKVMSKETTLEMSKETTLEMSKETTLEMSKATTEEMVVGRTNALNSMAGSFHGDSEPRTKFNELNEVSSRRRNNEAVEEINVVIDPASNVNAGKLGETFSGDNSKTMDQPIGEYDEVNKNRDLYSGSREEDSGGVPLLANQFNGVMDASSTTTGPDLVIPSPEVLSPNSDTIQLSSTSSASQDSWIGPSDAVIVVDVFRIGTDEVLTDTIATIKEIVLPVDRSKMMENRAMIQSPDFRPLARTYELTERTTIMLAESTAVTINASTTTNASVTENATVEATSTETTVITDEAFRPSIKPFEDAARQTLSEFHNEISFDEETFPDETTASTLSTARQRMVALESISPNARPVGRNRKVWTRVPRRKKKRTTPSMIKSNDLSIYLVGSKGKGRLSRVNPGYYGRRKDPSRPESAMKFSLEARKLNLVKKRAGVTGSFLREQRNYVQLSVDGSRNDINLPSEEHGPRKKYEEIGAGHDNLNKNDLNHPWLATTYSAEYTVRPSSSSNQISVKYRHRARQRSPENRVGSVTGRILPPCSRNKDQRIVDDGRDSICEAKMKRRRLLSVQEPKGDKHVAEHRSKKDKKQQENEESRYIEDQEGEYKGSSSESRKRLKSVRDKDREKSKKRDIARSTLKQKKGDEKRSNKKGLISSGENSAEAYDCLVPEYDDGTLLKEKQPEDDPEEFPADYGSMEESPDEDADPTAQVSQDESYNELNDETIPAHFDTLAEKLKIESQIRADRSKFENQDVGKDFEISLTGKIHLDNDEYGRPVSVSFDAAPGLVGKDSIPDGKANVYEDRSQSESANSFIDDTLVPGDNSNFLPDVFGVQSSQFGPFGTAGVADRSSAGGRYPRPVRAGNRAIEGYRNQLPARYRQRLLRLQKKSAETNWDAENKEAGSSKEVSKINEQHGLNGNPKRLKEDSLSSRPDEDGNFIPEETEARDDDQTSDFDENESLNVEDRNRAPLAISPIEEYSKKSLSDLLSDTPQVSPDPLDSDGSRLANNALEDANELVGGLRPITIAINTSQCYDANCTTLKIDIIEATTVGFREYATEADTSPGEPETYTETSGQPDTSPNSTESTVYRTYTAFNSTTSRFNTTNSTQTTIRRQPDNVTVMSTQEIVTETTTVVYEVQMPTMKPLAIFHLPKNESAVATGIQETTESVEKKNMLAVSDFVKKLEKLVAEAGNSSNATGHSLIHLKKFIIVPDNRTLWSVKEFSEPKLEQSADEVILMGDKGLQDKTRFAEKGGGWAQRESRTDNSNLIKEIISSVIRGDKVKRDESTSESNEIAGSKSSNGQSLGTCNDGSKGGLSDLRKGKRLDTPSSADKVPKVTVKRREDAIMEDTSSQDAGSHAADRFPGASLGILKELPKKDNEVCREDKSNVKRKRDVSRSDVSSVSSKEVGKNRGKGTEEGNKKRKKKKRRKKRKRKTKKKNGGRNKKDGDGHGGKWPFKRNLLMLSEGERVQASNENYGTERNREGRRKKILSAKGRTGGNVLKEPQIRGGQNCANHKHPRDVDPFKYLQSAHCLRFSDLWYSVYRLGDPVIDHKLHIQIYEKRTEPDGSDSWKDLANGSSIRLGTLDRHYRNPEDTMSLAYKDVNVTRNGEFNLDPTKDRLLVPSSLSSGSSEHLKAEGWSGEYLVVQANEINEGADECDKAGVGFAAFVGQPDRCERVRGTCLKNQPLAYWRHDAEARESGRAGCYFLSNFAPVPSEAIKYNVNGTGSHEFLALEYHSPHVSVIDVELRADYNALLRAGSFGRLTEAYSDSTEIDYTMITVLITNKASYSSSYRIRITDCPEGLPATWSNVESPMKTVSPQHDRKISLDLYGRLSLNEFSCSVALLNRDGESVANRQIKIRKMDRCFCVRHCKCSCEGNAHGRSDCEPMSLENYHAAGFRGPLPSMSYDFFAWRSPVIVVCLFFIALLLLLLLIGLLKWLIGLCAPTVGRWGLDAITEADKMKEYFEEDLKFRPVVFDHFGTPVHPDTLRKTVRVCNRKLEFLLNLIFFIVYPFAVCHWYRKSPSRAHSNSNVNVESQVEKSSLMSEEDEAATVCVSTYGDSINSKMELEDTRYVIDELKKSQESLRNRCGYKDSEEERERSSSSD